MFAAQTNPDYRGILEAAAHAGHQQFILTAEQGTISYPHWDSAGVATKVTTSSISGSGLKWWAMAMPLSGWPRSCEEWVSTVGKPMMQWGGHYEGFASRSDGLQSHHFDWIYVLLPPGAEL